MGEKAGQHLKRLLMDDCLFYALQIERYHPFERWKEFIEKVPEHCRKECREYLLGIHKRKGNQLKAVKEKGFYSVGEYNDFLEAKKKNPLLTEKQYLTYLRQKN